jgi:hypothetical protein
MEPYYVANIYSRSWRYQAFKAIFTSPSSAREADGDGDGANILENNRRARRSLNDQVKVKTCVASIINMRKVTPRSIAYVVCQVSKYDIPPSMSDLQSLSRRFASRYPASRPGAPSTATSIMRDSGTTLSTSSRTSLVLSHNVG